MTPPDGVIVLPARIYLTKKLRSPRNLSDARLKVNLFLLQIGLVEIRPEDSVNLLAGVPGKDDRD